MRTIQPKILEIPGAKLNGKKTSGKKFPKICIYLARLSGCIWKSWKMLFHSLLEVAEVQIVLDCLVELKAPFNFFCIENTRLTETEKKIEAR